MKTVFLLLSAFPLYSQTCSDIGAGSSLSNNGTGVSWHGFTAGAANSILRQKVTGYPVNSNSDTWMASLGSGVLMLTYGWYGTPGSTQQGYGWEGQTVHYVHGNSQRRMVMRANVEYAPMTAGTPRDPGTMPIPYAPRIAGLYGPNSRPEGLFLNRYLDPHCSACGVGDQQLHVVDVDNCIEYDAYQCYDLGSSVSCANYGAYYLAGGDLQRPWNIAATSNTSSVSGIPALFGRVSNDEYQAALADPTGHPIRHAIGITVTNLASGSFTGAATLGQYETGAHNNAKPPFGARFRLKASQYAGMVAALDGSVGAGVCTPFVTAWRDYGLVAFDGGGEGTFAVQENGTWAPNLCGLYMYGAFNGTNFEVVDQPDQPQVYCSYGSTGCPGGVTPINTSPVAGSPPKIASFTANGEPCLDISLGASIILAWSVSGVTDLQGNPIPLRNISYNVVPSDGTPPKSGYQLGPGWINAALHGEGVIVTPDRPGTFTYQLLVFNRFGPASKTVIVTVN